MSVKKKPQRQRLSKSSQYIGVLKSLGYTFKLNECTDNVEVNGEPMSDVLESKINVQIEDAGYAVGKDRLRDIFTSNAYDHSYHPVKDYFKSLRYDGDQHIQALASHFVDADDVFGLWLRRWLIGAVAKAMCGAQNAMLVLDGKQDIGKSTFAQWLASPLPHLFYDERINPDDKDNLVRLTRIWIWEAGELGSTMRRADVDTLKQFLTKETVTVRKSYGRHDIHKPALASFIGTVNNSHGILNDPTGSRRFLIANLTSIDFAYRSKVSIRDVWSEAHAAYLGGEDWRLLPAEIAKRTEINERYEVDDSIEGYLKNKFEIDPSEKTWFTPTNEILASLDSAGYKAGTTKALSMALSDALYKLGVLSGRYYISPSVQVRGYFGIREIKIVP
jgi:predicted P-loop ATPase